MLKIENKIKLTIKDTNKSPFLTGLFQSMDTEYTADTDSLEVIGEIPQDIAGVFVRNTHNQVHEPMGHYHPFDGDAMLHAAYFKDGKMEYRNRFVHTTGYLAEQAAGKSLWPGLLHPQDATRRGWGAIGAMKDNAGTDVICHAGKLIAVMSQGSEPYRLDPRTLENLGVDASWAKQVKEGIAGEFKVDHKTGDMIFQNYPMTPPYMNYGVVNKHNELVHYVPIELPGARWPHDLGMTENYSILHDLPFFFSDDNTGGKPKLEFYPEVKSRFGVIPRYGRSEDVRWFEATPCFVLHLANCYEDGDEIIMDGCISLNPAMPAVGDTTDMDAKILQHLDKHNTQTRLYRWRFNLKTGETKEQFLDQEVVEFPVCRNDYKGYKYNFAYTSLFEAGTWNMYGFKKFNLSAGTSERYEYGENRYGGEVHIAAKLNGIDEDDAYIITFVQDMNLDRSECILIDAKNIAAGPVARIILPQRITAGTHACWVELDRMNGER